MKKILILMGRYLPGHRDGGPLRTIVNVTEALGGEYEFYIACLDRDHGDTEPYPDIKFGTWNRVGKAKVWYVRPGGFTNELIQELAQGKDLIYLSSFYDDYGYRTLLLKKRGRITIPVALASMGVFAESALAQKSGKKRLFISGCKLAGLFSDITWSVTSEAELQDVKRVVGPNARCVIAEDLPRSTVPGRTGGIHDPLRIAFLSRICEHKGLDIAIDALARIEREFVFTVYGPIQEPDYWRVCQAKLAASGIRWRYEGDVPAENVQTVLANEDLLVLPTKSENYCHVVFEALSAGCIPIISDRTPWGAIAERQAGFVSERNMESFARILEDLITTSPKRLNEISCNAVRFAGEKATTAIKDTGYRVLFEGANG